MANTPPSTNPVAEPPSVYLSTSFYALVRSVGARQAEEIVQEEIERAPPVKNEQADREMFPVVRTLKRLQRLAPVAFHADFQGSTAAKSRTRAAHVFLQSSADVWIACDDDVEASLYTLRLLIAAVRGELGVCVAPCLLRGARHEAPLVNIAPYLDEALQTREIPLAIKDGTSGLAVPIKAAGFGCVAISRQALQAMVDAWPELVFVDDDGASKCALFLEAVTGSHSEYPEGIDAETGDPPRTWWSEDLSFFLRAARVAGMRVEALVTGQTAHARQILDLRTLPSRPCIRLVGWPPDGKAGEVDPMAQAIDAQAPVVLGGLRKEGAS